MTCLLHRARTGAVPGLLVSLTLAIGACDRLPGNAPARIAQGLEAAERGDYAEAYWWWRPLADAGIAEAQYQLGWLYANGNGLRVDVPAGIAWWERAALQGFVDAEFAIGMAYLNGESRTLKKDLARALEWLARAAEHGNADAREIVEQLLGSASERVIDLYPQLLRAPWLGTSVRVAADTASIFNKASSRAKTIAESPKGTPLRQIDDRSGWLLIVLPDDSGLGWIRKTDVAQAAGP